jgi:peptidyl-prolyl cis-trans isomerase SurA
MYNYYRDNLEEFNEDFKNQMTEFKDGNLFFEIMQQEIWNKAQTDSAALLDLYNKNKKKYLWKKSADVVFFFCSDQTLSQTLYNEINKNPANWKNVTTKYAEKVVVDSSRYEWNQLPSLNKTNPTAGTVTKPIVNETDNTASFVYIVKAYPQSMQRNFAEAKGLVINDYQLVLEDQWTAALRKKYPVVINKKVLSEIMK